MATMTDTLRVLQFGDSVFPVGAFSFSNGLESAVQHAAVRDKETLREFVGSVTRTAATGDGVALLVAHRGARAGDLDLVRDADEAVYLRKLNEETRTMTVRMGRKLAEAAGHIVGESLLTARMRDADAGGIAVTYPVALGVLFAALDLDEREAFAAHQYGAALMVLSAAVRLMRVDHLDTQAILFAVNETVPAMYEQVATAGLDEMQTFAPMADVLAAAHLHAHVRMFMN